MSSSPGDVENVPTGHFPVHSEAKLPFGPKVPGPQKFRVLDPVKTSYKSSLLLILETSHFERSQLTAVVLLNAAKRSSQKPQLV